jgi:hypothetical protein
MENETPLTFSHTAEYSYIDFTLKAQWEQFQQLSAEFTNFMPLEIADFYEERAHELARMKGLNPTLTETSLLELIDEQIIEQASIPMQLHMEFSRRIMSEYVTIAFLSHALCEAAINAILTIGLSAANSTELFSILQRSDIKEKWCVGPKSFHSPYTLPKNGSLYQTLHHLTRQRNALVHNRIEPEMRGKPVPRGWRLEYESYEAQLDWMGRFFSLPYDLAAHARKQIPQPLIMLLIDSRPIQRVSIHNVA